jgi:conjugative relaxase-like TrwC/TraI family protein
VSVAWVTTLGPDMGQIDYRLREDAGCSLNPGHDQQHEHGQHEQGRDRQVDYRLAGDRPLEWIGDGLRAVGIEPGAAMDEAAKDAARMLARGRDPREPDHTSRGVLVTPKKAVDPRAKLPARPLVDAIRAAAAAAGSDVEAFLAARADPRVVARFGRLQRGVAREEARQDGGAPSEVDVAHRAPVKDLAGLAAAAGVDLADVYDGEQLAVALEHADARVTVGNRGYDLTFDIPKSYSVLVAMADPATAAALEEVYLDAVRETVTAVQGWAGYGMRGHHGDGQTGTRVEGRGLLGWMNVHRTARPVGPGQPPDPHLHAHVTILNLVQGADGKWSTIGAGGRDIHRHAHAADAYLRARLRAVTAARWGVRWDRDLKTGAWEVAGVPADLRGLFSKRRGQVAEELHERGLTLAGDGDQAAPRASTAQAKEAAERSRKAKPAAGAGGDLRADWHAQAQAAGHAPGAVVAAAMPGPDPGPGHGPDRGPTPSPDHGPDRGLGGEGLGEDLQAPAAAGEHSEPARVGELAPAAAGPAGVDVAAVAAYVLRGESGQVGVKGGLTEHRKVVTRADVLAAVMDAVPAGLPDLAAGEALTDAVLDQGVAVVLPPAGQTHLTNAARYTSTEILTAEQQVLAVARDRYNNTTGPTPGPGYAQVSADVVALAVAQFEAVAGFSLSGEQRAVLDRLATAGHGVETVVGVAGSGKTTLMSALRAAHEAAGHTVAGAATAGVAAKNLRTEAGIQARTVAAWLTRIDQTGPLALAGVDVLVLDEAAMVDDRHVARLLAAAGVTGTQVVAIGDPLQLRAVGVGGTFAAVHQLIEGGELTENRRQRDTTERDALAIWRTGQRAATVQAWADAGRVHVTGTAVAAHEAMIDTWDQARAAWADPYERVEQLLLLAHTNTDVAALNARARTRRALRGELGDQTTIALADGTRLPLAVGDQVMTRRNDPGLQVLNGQRGILTAVDPGDGHTGDQSSSGPRVQVTRRETGPDGPQLVAVWLPAGYVAGDHTGPGLSHAYAITAAKAQGLTADRALVYGVGMDAHVLYPAMSRDRHRADLYLALDVLEDDATRARQGTPATDGEALQRAVAAYAATLDTPPDTLVSTQLGLTSLGDVPAPTPSQRAPAAPVSGLQAWLRPARGPLRPDTRPQDHPGPGQTLPVPVPDGLSGLGRVAAATAVSVPAPDPELDQAVVRAAREQAKIRLRAGHQQRLREAVEAELDTFATRPYGWTSTARLRRYAELGDDTDARTHPWDYYGPGAMRVRARDVAAAAGQAYPLLEQADAHQAAAEHAAQAAAGHQLALPAVQQQAAEHAAVRWQAEARAARPLVGRLHRATAEHARLAHQQALADLQAAWDRIHDAHAQAGQHQRAARDLAGQAIDLMRQAGAGLNLPPGPAGLAPGRIRAAITGALTQAQQRADQDDTRRQARLHDVLTELAHRDQLPPALARTMDDARSEHAARAAAAAAARQAEQARTHHFHSHDRGDGLGPSHGTGRTPGRGR